MEPVVEITPNQEDRMIIIKIRRVGEHDTFEQSLCRFLTTVSTKIKLHADCDPKVDDEMILFQRVPNSKDFDKSLATIHKLISRYSQNMVKEAETIGKLMQTQSFMVVHKINNPLQIRVEGTPDFLKEKL